MSITKTLPLAAALFASAAGMAHAEWPTDRPIEMIVAFAPGGGTDIMLRTLAPYLETELETQFPVLNRPGAAGEITYTALSQARPDGYTVSSLNTPGFLTMQINREPRFDPADLCPIRALSKTRAPSSFQRVPTIRRLTIWSPMPRPIPVRSRLEPRASERTSIWLCCSWSRLLTSI